MKAKKLIYISQFIITLIITISTSTISAQRQSRNRQTRNSTSQHLYQNTRYQHPALRPKRRKVIEKKAKQDYAKKTKIEIEIKTGMDSKTIAEAIKQAAKERDISKKIKLIKDALIKYSTSRKSKSKNRVKVSYKLGNKIMWMILGLIRNSSRYKIKEIEFLTDFLEEINSNGSIKSLPNPRFAKKIPEYINSLEIKSILKNILEKKGFDEKIYWCMQALNKIDKKTKFADKNKVFSEIKKLISLAKTDEEKNSLKRLVNTLNKKSNFFKNNRDKRYIEMLIKQFSL